MKYLGTKRHHDKYLAGTEDYHYSGCFALTELGHGSNVSYPVCPFWHSFCTSSYFAPESGGTLNLATNVVADTF